MPRKISTTQPNTKALEPIDMNENLLDEKINSQDDAKKQVSININSLSDIELEQIIEDTPSNILVEHLISLLTQGLITQSQYLWTLQNDKVKNAINPIPQKNNDTLRRDILVWLLEDEKFFLGKFSYLVHFWLTQILNEDEYLHFRLLWDNNLQELFTKHKEGDKYNKDKSKWFTLIGSVSPYLKRSKMQSSFDAFMDYIEPVIIDDESVTLDPINFIEL